MLWRGEAAGAARRRPAVRAARAALRRTGLAARAGARRSGGSRPSWRPRPAGGCLRLRKLEEAVASGALKGLPRGLAYRLIEAGGVLARAGLEAELRSLSQAERRALRVLGVRIGAFALFLPELAGPALAFARGLRAGRRAGLASDRGRPHRPADAGPGAAGAGAARSCRGRRLRRAGEPAGTAGRAAARRRQARRRRALLRPGARGAGLERAPRRGGAARRWASRRSGAAPTQVWRRKAEPRAKRPPPQAADAGSPFAALAALQPAPRRAAARRPQRRRHG